MRYFLFCLAVVTGAVAYPQDKGEPIVLHTKEIHRAQDEGTEKGTWYHITVTAESKTVIYTLELGDELGDRRDVTQPPFTPDAPGSGFWYPGLGLLFSS